MSKVLGIIPARIDSTRLPRKMLADLAGKPLIIHTLERAQKARLLDRVIVATDSDEIFRAVADGGGEAVMTPPDCRSGTERVAAAARKFPKAELVINIQGDEPLLNYRAVDAVVKRLKKEPTLNVATAAVSLFGEELESPNFVKVVLDKNGNAIYFSRSLIPHPRNPHDGFLKHIGIYGFRRRFLARYAKMPQTPLELAESLEQLRILENEYDIGVVVGDFDSISVDTPDDLMRVRNLIEKRNDG